MLKRSADAGNALCPPGSEVVYRNEPVLQVGDHGKEVCREDFIVGPAGTDDRIQDHPVYGAEMMVGNRDETALRRDVGQLFPGDFIGDPQVFQDSGGESGTVGPGSPGMKPVSLAHPQHAEQQPGEDFSGEALQTEGVLHCIVVQ